MGREMGGKFRREGIYVYLCLIHVEVCQKTAKFCKAISFNKKKIFLIDTPKKKKKKNACVHVTQEAGEEPVRGRREALGFRKGAGARGAALPGHVPCGRPSPCVCTLPRCAEHGCAPLRSGLPRPGEEILL